MVTRSDPPEQTAGQLAEALQASKDSISGATGMLVRMHPADRDHIRGERADRFGSGLRRGTSSWRTRPPPRHASFSLRGSRQ